MLGYIPNLKKKMSFSIKKALTFTNNREYGRIFENQKEILLQNKGKKKKENPKREHHH